MKLRRLSHQQKRLLTIALISGAASARELARWSGLAVHSVHRIARVFSGHDRNHRYNQFARMWWGDLKKLRP